MNITNDERITWVENNKTLYSMWNLTNDTLEAFVRKNAPVIDQVIKHVMITAQAKALLQIDMAKCGTSLEFLSTLTLISTRNDWLKYLQQVASYENAAASEEPGKSIVARLSVVEAELAKRDLLIAVGAEGAAEMSDVDWQRDATMAEREAWCAADSEFEFIDRSGRPYFLKAILPHAPEHIRTRALNFKRVERLE